MGLISRFLSKKSATVDGPDPGHWHDLGIADADGFGSYDAQVLRGYADNPYVMRCIDLLGNAVASLEPITYDAEGNEVTEPRLRSVLRRPNPLESWQEFAYERVADFNLNGNLFAIPITTIRGVEEMWGVPPGRVTYNQTNNLTHPVSIWIVENGSGAIMVEPTRMVHAHKKLSVNSVVGVSPLSAAGKSIVQQTESRKWNLSLMRNGAKPSIVIQDPNPMTPSQFRDFVSRVGANHAGVNRAGSVMVLDNGKTMGSAGFNARDMDYSAGVTTSGREIAIALGVPPELVGDSANKTYSNAQEANREFAMHTVMPQADRFFGALSARICPHYEGVAYIGYDEAQIDGLKGDEATMLTSLESCSFLTVNEKRARLGYPPVDGGDVVMTGMDKVPLSETSTPIPNLMDYDT